MAIMYPRALPGEVRSAPERDAECRVYDALAKLPGDYRVFYSVAWLGRTDKKGAFEGEADFVIVHPELGVLVLEVKGGTISRDSETGKWYTETRKARNRYEITDPIAQARRNKYSLAEKLQSLPGWVAGRAKLGHAIAFPHCIGNSDTLGLDCPAELVLFESDLDEIQSAVRRVYEWWAGSSMSCTPVHAATMRAVVNLFSPSIELRGAVRSPGADVTAAEKSIAELTSNQAKVLNSLARNRRTAISGGAGTGKTMLALAKAKNLATQGFRTLLTCYNRPLADHLRTCAQGCVSLEVADFHQYCLARIGLAGLSAGRPEGFNYWDEIVPETLVEAWAALPNDRFDAIVVDEAQDFADGWWVPLQLALRDPDDGILYVFYDDNQRLYRRVSSFPVCPTEYRLCENLRNTKPIHLTAARFYKGGELLAAGPNGPQVEFVLASDSASQKREIGKLVEKYTSGGVQARDIAVLTGRSVDVSRAGLTGAFGSHRWTRDQARDPDRVLFESISRFKGLERPVIILTDLEDHASAGRDESIYVGLSRARARLAIVGNSEVIKYVGGDLRRDDRADGPTDYLKALLGDP